MSTREQDAEGISGGVEERLSDGETAGAGPEGDNEPVNPNESAKETLERFLGDAATTDEQLPGDKGEKESEPEETEAPREVAPKAQKGKAPKDDFDPELLPPERLSERGRKAFQNLPPGLRREVHKSVREVEAMATRATQEARAELKEWAPLREAIAPIARRWADFGISLPQGMLQLASVQEKLTDKNYEVREQQLLKLSRQSKVDLVKLARKIVADQGDPDGDAEQFAAHEHRAKSRDENTELANRLRNLESQSEQARLAPLLHEMETVRNEKDPASGQLLRPALQDETFLNSVKPLVSEELGSAPEITLGEAFKRAYERRMRMVFGESWQPVRTRIPAPNSTNNTRALTAGISVRGRTAPTASAMEPEVPAEVGTDTKRSLEYFLNGAR